MATKKNGQAWAEAKKRCRLNEADIKMAKELGMTPKSLMKSIPAPNEHWKYSVKVWIHELYEDKFGKVLTVNHEIKRKPKKQKEQIDADYWMEEDLPF